MYHNYRERCTSGLACGVLVVPPARACLPGDALIQGECCKFLPLCLQFDNEVLPDFSGWARAPVAEQSSSSCSPFHPPPPATAHHRLSDRLSDRHCFSIRRAEPLPSLSVSHPPTHPPELSVAVYPTTSPRHPLPFASPTTSRVTHYRSRHLLPLASPGVGTPFFLVYLVQS
jgi:hypothetical protein